MEKTTSNDLPLVSDKFFDTLLISEEMVAYEFYQQHTHYEPMMWIHVPGTVPVLLNPGDLSRLGAKLESAGRRCRGEGVPAYFLMVPHKVFKAGVDTKREVTIVIGCRPDLTFNVGFMEEDRDEDGRYYLRREGEYSVTSPNKPSVVLPLNAFWDGYTRR